MNITKFLEDILQLPKTEEAALKYVKDNPVLKSSVEELAFKQTIKSILILAGIVTENDFDLSCEHFKNNLYESLAKELLEAAQQFEEEMRAEEEKEDDDWDDWPDNGHLPQA